MKQNDKENRYVSAESLEFNLSKSDRYYAPKCTQLYYYDTQSCLIYVLHTLALQNRTHNTRKQTIRVKSFLEAKYGRKVSNIKIKKKVQLYCLDTFGISRITGSISHARLAWEFLLLKKKKNQQPPRTSLMITKNSARCAVYSNDMRRDTINEGKIHSRAYADYRL